jgi:N-acyl homoserine lactone hydrolase
MTVKLYAFTCGTVTGEFAHLMQGGEGDITVPVPVFLIEHPKGRALFDTGLHPIASTTILTVRLRDSHQTGSMRWSGR